MIHKVHSFHFIPHFTSAFSGASDLYSVISVCLNNEHLFHLLHFRAKTSYCWIYLPLVFILALSVDEATSERKTHPSLFTFFIGKDTLWIIYFSVLMSARTSYSWFQRDEMVLRGGLSLYDRRIYRCSCYGLYPVIRDFVTERLPFSV